MFRDIKPYRALNDLAYVYKTLVIRSFQGLPDQQWIEVPRDAIANTSLGKVNTIAQRTTKAKKRKQLQDVFVRQTQCEDWEEAVDRYDHYAEDTDKCIGIFFILEFLLPLRFLLNPMRII